MSSFSTVSNSNDSPRNDRVFWLILGIAALLGLGYNAAILLGFGPDEPRHLAYVRLLVEERRLPFQLPGGAEYAGAHSYHPPLYYGILAPFYAILGFLGESGRYHALRLVSLALCLGALPLIYQIAARAANGNRIVARFTTAGVALLPIFGMTGGILNNDSALLFFVTLFLWALVVRFPNDQNVKSALILGVIFGLAALTKATAILCNGAALLVYLWLQNGRRAPLQGAFWKRLALVLLVGIAICGPWYARNTQLYGTYQPVPVGYTSPALPNPSNGALVMAMHPNFPTLFGIANRGIFNTLWAQRDWLMQRQTNPPSVAIQPVQGAIYLALFAYVALAGVGHLNRKRISSDSTDSFSPHERKLAVCVPYAAFAIAWIVCLQVALFVHWGQAEGGRYLLPGICGFALFIARGYDAILGARTKWILLGWSLFALALNALCLYWLLAYLNPTYG